MSALTIYADNAPEQGWLYTDFADIKDQLDAIGVQFERWTANCELAADASNEAILAAYEDSIARLKQQYGFQSVDVISLKPDHPEKGMLRQKFLAEHTHSDFEVRFFIEGSGLFYLHVAGKVYAVLCGQGDLISVPAHATHWFDMGENPNFKCIRLFTTPEGWVAEFTGSTIAQQFPTYEQYVAML
ncbi:1,2-dihydroxy-3-keto-5-methylthiopentene dioxygenase [Methylobacter sp. YRD-M1]|uniref:1,2-dihydroxy-3-keto-5-methylthiopentene dioxygenase n=1 Tax=Methylobacter sp. YRD-M1 TaxID=2911520 RepID=UPI00227AC311|nr:cupin [Methylobacter sp. YRD-M1]WAK02572.1 cupin [Methylobacter sp. YRD-M1]